MNDPRLNCEFRYEAISLLAADCLTDQEEGELREHFAVCEACHQRYEEITLVSSNVRIAKPAVKPESLLALERCLQHLPLPVRHVAQPVRSVVRRVAILAASVLVLVGVLGQFAVRRTEPKPAPSTEVVQRLPQKAPVESSDLRLPTLFHLSRAAAESDESLNRLLARYSEPTLLEPLNSLNRHTLSLESL